MKKLLTMAFLFCLTSSIANAQEIIDLNKAMKCSNPQTVIDYFANNHNERPVWVGKTVHNSNITLLMNKETRSWTMVEYDANLACVLGAGENSTGSDPKFNVRINTY